MSKRCIRISNPQPCSATHTSVKSAANYVARGRAQWVKPGVIEFLESDTASKTIRRVSVFLEAGQMRMATLGELKHTPVIGAQRLFR